LTPFELKSFENQVQRNVDEIKKTIVNIDGKLSTRIATRLYRAPEVIIYEKHYFKPMDIWGCGVIMADLFKFISPNAPPIDPSKKTNKL